MKKLFAMLPCYNEEENIEKLIIAWEGQKQNILNKGYELVIAGIDDKSTDNTKKIIARLAGENDNVVLIAHEVNKNLGGGLMTAFKYFTENGKDEDLCVLMDGDNTHDPKYVLPMLDKIGMGADCVIASRYCENSNVVGVPKNRLFLSDGARIYYKLMLNVKNVEDYTCGYRVYTYNIVEKAQKVYGEKFVERTSFACMMEVLYKLNQVGAKFAEVPFELRYDNKGGASKMRILKTVKDSLVTALALRFTVKKSK